MSTVDVCALFRESRGGGGGEINNIPPTASIDYYGMSRKAGL